MNIKFIKNLEEEIKTKSIEEIKKRLKNGGMTFNEIKKLNFKYDKKNSELYITGPDELIKKATKISELC